MATRTDRTSPAPHGLPTRSLSLWLLGLCLFPAPGPGATGGTLMRLPTDPALSPDGATVAFCWRGDIWTAPVAGGTAHQLTRDPAEDSQPAFSPDGQKLAFISTRTGSRQVFIMPATGGSAEPVTRHTEGHALHSWTPDGASLLVGITRDHFWRHAERFSILSTAAPSAETILFDDYGDHGCLSPDGRQLLFTREGERWWRKGYHGSRASQIWLYHLPDQSFQKLLDHPAGSQWPLWKPDGSGFYFVGARQGTSNLHFYDLAHGSEHPLTHFEDDGVLFPTLSRDGSTMVFRRLFDLYRLDPNGDAPPEQIPLFAPADLDTPREERRELSKASQAAFSKDGLEIAFIAGGDLWVMDTELREPRQVTATPEEESSPVFSPDGQFIFLVSDQGGQPDLWKITRSNPKVYWWQNTDFVLEPITRDPEPESHLQFSPQGSRLAYLKGRGDLWLAQADGSAPHRLLESWNPPDYDWSPDGRWLVYARSDDNFNRDIWLLPADGSAAPFNLSRHPDNDEAPLWSPDGKIIAFTGRRIDTEVDLYFVWLGRPDEEKDTRQRTLEKALEKMKKSRNPKPGSPPQGKDEPKPAAAPVPPGDPAPPDPEPAPAEPASGQKETKPKTIPEVVIDLDGIHERIHRISLPHTSPTDLVWSHDSKKLAFTATLDGKKGTYTVEVPSDLKPKLLSEKTGTQARWIAEGDQIVWLTEGVPGSLSAAGKAQTYPFLARQRLDLPARYQAAFDLCWRTMRDRYYDENLGPHDWDAIRNKYHDVAGIVPDGQALTELIHMMLGELNGSHLGFSYQPESAPGKTPSWNDITPHLGIRFDPHHPGPGLRIRDVLPRGPADRKEFAIQAGDIVRQINGQAVDPKTDLAALLTGSPDRDVTLTVQSAPPSGRRRRPPVDPPSARDLTLRPITYGAARQLLYEKWIKDNRQFVEQFSQGRLGYLHIQGMNTPSFHRFEQELYAAGAGRQGLIIDVRENGGGSTTDHLLTALTQPRHALTVPRGGGPGYPQDRTVYATWDRPIVVLCNQNSFSNAEIFSHAIKTLQRGKLVGVPTAGGVISTGSTRIMDLGHLRLPFRGWFLVPNGQDMELNGAVPLHVIWPRPGDMPAGRDLQLKKAVQVLQREVRKNLRQPLPPLIKASER